MMTFREYVDGINMGVFQRLHKPAGVKLRPDVSNERRGVKIQVYLPEAQLLRITLNLGERHVRRGAGSLCCND
jgi:hypothetical protein